MRVGRFELDPADARARRHLAAVAWVPRGRREALATRVAAAAPALAGPRMLRAMGAPGPDAPLARGGGVVDRDVALRAATEALGAAAGSLGAPLAMLPAPTSAAPRRLLWLWRQADEHPFAVAKVAPADAAGPLAAEAQAIERVRDLGVRALRGVLPEVLAFVKGRILATLVLRALPGEPLLRVHRLRRPLHWDEAPLASAGLCLGALHAATRRGDVALLHGDAWSRNVLVQGGAVTGLIDWEASREGEPAAEIAFFLLASARADAAGRSILPPPRLPAWPAGARALVDSWSAAMGSPAGTRERVELLLQDARTREAHAASETPS